MGWFKSPKAERTFSEATRSLAALNGAGIAGIIALMQRPGPVSVSLVLAGGLFLSGTMSAGAAWSMAFIVEEGQPSLGDKLEAPMIGCFLGSGAAFLVGVAVAFISTAFFR